MFELSTEWYRAHEGTPHLEDTVSTYETLLQDRIGETVRVYVMALDGKTVLDAHEEGVLEEVYRGEHNIKGLIQLKIKVSFSDPLFAPLGVLSTAPWKYLYLPDFVRFAADEDSDPKRAAVVEAWKEKKRAEHVEREKYNKWLDNRLEEVVLARWDGMSWDRLRKNFNTFRRQTYEFTMVTSTPNFRNYTESITSTTLGRAMCRVFKNKGITLSDIENRARAGETAADYLNRHFKLYHYKTRGGNKVYDGQLVIDWLSAPTQGE